MNTSGDEDDISIGDLLHHGIFNDTAAINSGCKDSLVVQRIPFFVVISLASS